MNLILWPRDEDDARDPRIAGVLSELDPGRDDPTYWLGFLLMSAMGVRW